jgi:hypothetical protein
VRRVLGVAALARAGQFVEAFLAVLVADRAGAGAAVVGIVLLLQQAGATAGSAIAGPAVDRLGARLVATCGLVTAALSVLVLAATEQVPALLAAAGAYGLASSGWRLALQAALARGVATGTAASGNGAADRRAQAYGALVWVSNAGALLSGVLAVAGVPIRAAFAAQAILLAAAAVAAALLPGGRRAGVQSVRRRPVDPKLWVVAAAFAPATLVMFQAFSGLAVALEADAYRRMVVVNAAVLVLGQPVVRVLARRLPAGALLAGSALILGVGIALTARLEGSFLATAGWSLAELVLITLAPAAVAGAAPQAQLGRHQAVFQVSQGVVAATATLAGPLVAAGSTTLFSLACVTSGIAAALLLVRSSTTLAGALAHPLACPCGSLRCVCDAGHSLCSSPSPAIVHAATAIRIGPAHGLRDADALGGVSTAP